MRWKLWTFPLALFLLVIWTNAEELDDDVTVTEEPDQPDDFVYETPTADPKKFNFAETFDDKTDFERKWVKSEAKKDGIDEVIAKYNGWFAVEAPQRERLYGDLGLVLKTKAKHAAIAAKLDRAFEFAEKPFVAQYEVILQEGQECGGAYLKLLSQGKATDDLRQFNDKTPYTIMFGPDKCGGDHKLHFIFRHVNPRNGTITEKHLIKKSKERLEEFFSDKLPHLYTLITRPDQTFEIRVDNKLFVDGNLLEDFEPPVNPPAEIDDPTDKKPDDWDEREKIPDETAVKPDDWDEDAPAEIDDPNALKPEGWLDESPMFVPDTSAKKPDDWDNDMDGEWEPPLIKNPVCENAPGCGEWKPPKIPNPNYKGKWRAPVIDNPNYKGKWSPRRISNPDYFEDLTPFKMTSISAVGFELWSMSNNILFDNIVITDSVEAAEEWSRATFELKRLKIDKSATTLWGRLMRSINYSPKVWTAYLIYCTIPVVCYIVFLVRRLRQESLWTRVLKFTTDNPWIWVVYVLVFGLPVVLVLVFCCSSSSSKDNEELRRQAAAKKTDAYTPDVVDESEAKGVDETDLVGDVDESGKSEEAAEAEAVVRETTPKSRGPSREKSDLSDDVNEDASNDVPEETTNDVPRKRRVRKD